MICLVATPAQAAAHEQQLPRGVALKLSHVDVHERYPKTLKWDAETLLQVDYEAQPTLRVFPYEKYTVYVQHYASLSFVESEECVVGTLVSLPVMAVDIEEAWSKAGVAYARVMLVDADRATIGPLHLLDIFPTTWKPTACICSAG